MNIKIFFTLIIILVSHSIIDAQSAFKNVDSKTKNFEFELGTFLNIGSEQFEFDGYLEMKTRSGIFSDIWFDQVDLNQDSDVQRYASIGFMKEVKNNHILGFGYANSMINLDESIHEIFIGMTLYSVTGMGYFDVQNKNFSVIGNFDISSIINFKKFDISIDGLLYGRNIDMFCRLSKAYNNGFSIGYIFSRERFESSDYKSFEKNGNTYIKEIPLEKNGFFNSIFIGYVF
ncbi:MAG: hypothetical protein CMF95_03045 [Candidatus Marinimicrobia bacterium]|nr:hypothetical protein [Candidatus Neomarinimicrobiota bacterium]|tara:strand:+ start:4432 stop:5124 length:693 start_codon:yes stop_codon:yes gene_type:complete